MNRTHRIGRLAGLVAVASTIAACFISGAPADATARKASGPALTSTAETLPWGKGGAAQWAAQASAQVRATNWRRVLTADGCRPETIKIHLFTTAVGAGTGLPVGTPLTSVSAICIPTATAASGGGASPLLQPPGNPGDCHNFSIYYRYAAICLGTYYKNSTFMVQDIFKIESNNFDGTVHDEIGHASESTCNQGTLVVNGPSYSNPPLGSWIYLSTPYTGYYRWSATGWWGEFPGEWTRMGSVCDWF